MTVSANFAANAYASQMKVGEELAKSAKTSGAVEDTGEFSDLVKNALSSVADSGQKAEVTAANVASGQGDLVDLVTTIAETEVAVETLVTTRDRVISAYRDIMNMPI
ncbi:MAG: flagellar hook-basal body complex protein FliE [Rhizobiales bacterium]|nr:flagellar hook-basal body complex protein FliE [Hyphomicrobiales bacterium]